MLTSEQIERLKVVRGEALALSLSRLKSDGEAGELLGPTVDFILSGWQLCDKDEIETGRLAQVVGLVIVFLAHAEKENENVG